MAVGSGADVAADAAGGSAGGGVDADDIAVGGTAAGGAGSGSVDADPTAVGGRDGGDACGGVDAATAVGGRAGGGACVGVTAVGGRADGGPGAAVSSDVDAVVGTAIAVEVEVVGCTPMEQCHGSIGYSRRVSVAGVDVFRVFYCRQRRREGRRKAWFQAAAASVDVRDTDSARV